jgi:hypothetical protein
MLRLVSFTASIWFLQRYPDNVPTEVPTRKPYSNTSSITPNIFLGSVGPRSYCGIGIITLFPTESSLNFRFVVLISFSALLPQLETEEDLEQILADTGVGDTTDGTTDDDESAISTDISEADTDSNIPSAEALQSTSSLVTTEIAAPNSEETPVVQIYRYNL